MPLENVVCIDPKNTNLQKNRGGGGIPPPPRPLTSEKYLGPERVKMHFSATNVNLQKLVHPLLNLKCITVYLCGCIFPSFRGYASFGLQYKVIYLKKKSIFLSKQRKGYDGLVFCACDLTRHMKSSFLVNE